jgi:hypothetical protein
MVAQIRTQIAALESQKVATPEQLDQLTKLRESLERLNSLNFSPMKRTLDQLRENWKQFVDEGVSSFADFFANLTSGQENSGRKLLASFVQIIGKMLVQMGTMLISTGIAEVFAASTLYGRMMGASASAGYRAIAEGSVLAALGGAAMGAATSLSQSSSTSASSTSTSSSSSSAPQVISVGRPNSDQASTQSSQPKQLGIITLRLDRGVVVDEVKTNIQNNGVLRTVIQKVHA